MKRLLIIAGFIVMNHNDLLAQKDQLQIHTGFPGGNILVEKIDKDTVWLRPDLRDTEGHWFYWYFKITGISGRTVQFRFSTKPVFARFGPAYSINNDSTWKWYGEKSYTDTEFSFPFSEADTAAYFSMAFPYTQKDLSDFLKNQEPADILKLDTLCFSRQGRAVEQIHLRPLHPPKYKVLITARNHACEMMANYVLEGIISSIIHETGLQYLRDRVEFCMIPFVDKDGVENGDQGKNRKPRDHNRDYDDHSIYPTVKAIKAKIPGWSDNKLKIALDLHCPYIRGNNDEYISFVGGRNKTMEKQETLLSELTGKNSINELKFYSKKFVYFGTSWNTEESYTKGSTFANWAATVPGIAVATTLEFPYSNVSGIAVSKDNARAFGRSIAYAMMDYLKSLH